MKALFVLNAAPYGDERSYNGLRLAGALAKQSEHEVRIFLQGDAAPTAKAGQRVPEGFYNLQLMLSRVARSGEGRVGVCGTCMDARGLTEPELAPGTHRGTLDELAQWTVWADKVLVF
jgi:uncharacterized protein involved in oxidation of intracellular sulfur